MRTNGRIRWSTLLLAVAAGCASPIHFPGHLPRFAVQVQGSNISSLELSPDGGRLATAEFTRGWTASEVVIEVWDVPTGRRIAAIPCPPGEIIRKLAWSSDATLLAYAVTSPQGRIAILDGGTGKERRSFLEGPIQDAQIEFTPDDSSLASLVVRQPVFMSESFDLDFQIREVESGRSRSSFQAVTGGGLGLFSIRGASLVWKDVRQRRLGLWSLESGKTVFLEPIGNLHAGWVRFSQDERYLLVTRATRGFFATSAVHADRFFVVDLDAGGSVVYEQAIDGEEPELPEFVRPGPRLLPFKGVGWIRRSKDQKTVVTADFDGLIKFWDGDGLLQREK